MEWYGGLMVKDPYGTWHACCTLEVVAIKRVLEFCRCFYVLVAGLKASNRYIVSEKKKNIEDKNKGKKKCSQRASSLLLQDESTCSKAYKLCHSCINAWEPLIF